MDRFVLGNRCVNCEIIEADGKGNTPDQDDFDGSSQSLLDVIVENNNEVIPHTEYIMLCIFIRTYVCMNYTCDV